MRAAAPLKFHRRWGIAPWDTAPRYLLRHRDASYGRYFQPGRGDGDHGSHCGAAFCQGEDR